MSKKIYTNTNELFNYAVDNGHGKLHIKHDAATGLTAIISIHSNKLGPALGGCRFIHYENFSEAVYDALRLARGMTYKAAAANLNLGGGKAVLVKPQEKFNREDLLKSFGNFVQELGGSYITAVDSGTSVADMDIISQQTSFVTCITKRGGDPAAATSYGVFKGIMAAVYYRWQRTDLEKLKVVVQGAGNVGSLVAKHLKDLGAQIIIADTNLKAAEKLADKLQAMVVAPDDVYDVPCDIFVPCALGGIINHDTISKFTAKIIAGAANNQLSSKEYAQKLLKRDITYVPDYVINAGGLIEASAYYHDTYSKDVINNEISKIYDTVLTILEESKLVDQDTATIADKLAEKRLQNV